MTETEKKLTDALRVALVTIENALGGYLPRDIQSELRKCAKEQTK